MPASLTAPGAIQPIVLGVLPVIVFLAGLTVMDSYRLVRPTAVLRSVFVGFVAAGLAMAVARGALGWTGWTRADYGVLAGPVLEEALKAAFVAFLVVTKRVGFMVDAAIHGFAVGAGFAVLENVIYLSPADVTVPLALARGFGAALMHGGATAIFGIAAKRFVEERGPRSGAGLAAGFAVASIFHVLFNRAVASPVLAIAGVVAALPVALFLFFRESERSLRSWLGIGFDTDAEMLEMMEDGKLSDSHVGTYLSSLRDRLPPEIVADMLCMLRLRVELSVRAKGILLMRDEGFEAPVDPEVRERFEELRYLERSIGRTGMLAMLPLLSWRHRDLWEMHMLAGRR
ncbi:MAG: PrsW family glutamic-type intramembrane protease [Candidatus Eisenbacteria bacterium]